MVVGVSVISYTWASPPGGSPATFYRLGKLNLRRLRRLPERPLPSTIKVRHPVSVSPLTGRVLHAKDLGPVATLMHVMLSTVKDTYLRSYHTDCKYL